MCDSVEHFKKRRLKKKQMFLPKNTPPQNYVILNHCIPKLPGNKRCSLSDSTVVSLPGTEARTSFPLTELNGHGAIPLGCTYTCRLSTIYDTFYKLLRGWKDE